jgi:HSP20 family protein
MSGTYRYVGQRPFDWREPASGNGDSEPADDLRSRLNDLFDEFFRKIGTQHSSVSGRALPGVPGQADVSTSESDWQVEIDLPGIKRENIEVTADEDSLTVAAVRDDERERSGRDYYFCERSHGRCERRFRLPPDMEPDKAKARYRDGVLTITVPRKPGKKKKPSKTIPIAAG